MKKAESLQLGGSVDEGEKMGQIWVLSTTLGDIWENVGDFSKNVGGFSENVGDFPKNMGDTTENLGDYLSQHGDNLWKAPASLPYLKDNIRVLTYDSKALFMNTVPNTYVTYKLSIG